MIGNFTIISVKCIKENPVTTMIKTYLPVKELIGDPISTLDSGTELILWLIKLVALLQLVSLSDENTGGWIGHFSFR